MAAEFVARTSGPDRSALAMPAQWDRDGKAAGPIRNARMIEVAVAMQACGWLVEVQAFPLPGSRGTVDMMERCKRAGFSVIDHGGRSMVWTG